jgi:hypothetical protein
MGRREKNCWSDKWERNGGKGVRGRKVTGGTEGEGNNPTLQKPMQNFSRGRGEDGETSEPQLEKPVVAHELP